jgi:hypothetical protein
MRYWIPYLAASIGLHLAAVVTAAVYITLVYTLVNLGGR